MRNISMFIFNFNYIKDLARITMDEKCNGIYCEAETDRYQIAKNSYNLLMPNDVFNSKTYTIFVFIISIMIFIYYYRMLINFKDNPKTSRTITLSFFIILIIIIGVRYVPNDEQGYKNYYKNVYSTGQNAHRDAIALIVTLIVFIIVLLVIQVLYTKGKMNVPESWSLYFWFWDWYNIWNWNFRNWDWLIDAIRILLNNKGELFIEFIKLTCFFISITLVFNLMNIVMTFRKNTTPILKTKPLSYSLRNSLNNHVNYRCTPRIMDVDESALPDYQKIKKEYFKVVKFQNDKTNKENIIKYIKEIKKRDINVINTDATIFDNDNKLINGANLDNITIKGGNTIIGGVFNDSKYEFNDISSGLDIYIAFEELSKIILYSRDEGSYKYNEKKSIKDDVYIQKLKNTINMSDVSITNDPEYSSTLSLIFDEKVSIPKDYNYSLNEHTLNSNDKNTDYEYTADISYDNANVFYEKYWDMKDTDGNLSGEFLDIYSYFVPNNLSFLMGVNLYRFNLFVASFIIIIIFLMIIFYFTSNFTNGISIKIETIYEILFPFIALVVFITYIIVFIRFNTNFNKNVIYKCLDCSYKRALNKLNTIVSPYIRMYDNKITGGNKNYTHHYIITNVFYSILSGNINLSDDATVNSININNKEDDKNYTAINKSNGLKFADMNSSILSNDNQYREYYKTRFSNLYKEKYDIEEVNNIYAVFSNIFTNNTVLTTREHIDTYFKGNITRPLILKIYCIIKKCIELFDEEKFNRDVSSPISIESYNNFKFYKGKNKLIPHKFILVLKTKAVRDTFVGTNVYNFDDILSTKLQITDTSNSANMTGILKDITNEDSTNQNKDIQDKNMIKIIAKYLLIMGHINYNRISYNAELVTASKTQEKVDENKKNIYILQTLGLYRLISNVSYADTFKIDDTFGKTLLITDSKYYTLTYMYNYLDTKYVILSSNKNNNYLLNIIKSINNTLNNDNKTTIANDIKEARYLFRDRINDIEPEKQYENEDAILMKAHEISTTSFESTYFINMLILLLYITGTIFFKIK